MSRVISGKDQHAQRWEPPEIQQAEQLQRAEYHEGLDALRRQLSTEGLEAIRKQAHDDGFHQGYRDGKAAAEAELSALHDELKHLISALIDPLDKLDHKLEKELMRLAFTIAKHVIRREIKAEPTQVVAVVKEGLKLLATSPRDIALHLHPDDADIVRRALSAEERPDTLRIIEDPIITRGGCKLATAISQIDATLEAQVGEIAAKLMGGDRAEDADIQSELRE